jgi:hypothetical protein
MVEVENDAGAVDNYDSKIERDAYYPDEYKLTSIYLKALQSYFKFTSTLHQSCKESTIAKVEKAVEKKILALEEKLTKTEGLEGVKESVQVKVQAYNVLGIRFGLDELVTKGEDYRNYLIVVRLSVDNIQSVIEPGKSLGSIVIADTFVFSHKYEWSLT